MSTLAENLIKEFEQCKLTAYKDGGGVFTIGWGTTKGVHEGMVWTQAQADKAFLLDLLDVEASVKNLYPKADEYQFAALCSFTYNLGAGCLRTLISNRTQEQVADAILLYCKDNGRPVRGLKIRRAVEREIFLMKPVDVKALRAKFTAIVT
jgi:lysozyme